MPKLPPIIFIKTVINGLLARPDSRHVVQKAVEGHPIEVTSGNDYINLYHVFERMQAREKHLSRLAMFRQQIGASKWVVTIGADKDEVPEHSLDPGYDPKRGRYKRYADQLAAGETLKFPSRSEATKARRAWQLYVAKEDRKHLRSTVRARGKAFAVSIVERDGRER